MLEHRRVAGATKKSGGLHPARPSVHLRDPCPKGPLNVPMSMRRFTAAIAFVATMPALAGCGPVYKLIVEQQPEGDANVGITYYVGGAGPLGNVGSFDVPGGLRDAAYRGHVEIFTWQSWTHAGDQINLNSNREKAAQLRDHISRYRRAHPDKEINIIGLSAGTGIAVFALEYLPEDIGINHCLLLGCSLSSKYDMTRALKRIKGKAYVLYSPHDRMLKNVVWYTGTVDRSAGDQGIAGLEGFWMPPSPRPDTAAQYQKMHNVGYRSEFVSAGHKAGHIGATARSFVRRYIGPAVLGKDARLLGPHPERRYSAAPEKTPSTMPDTAPKSMPASGPASRPGKERDAPTHEGR